MFNPQSLTSWPIDIREWIKSASAERMYSARGLHTAWEVNNEASIGGGSKVQNTAPALKAATSSRLRGTLNMLGVPRITMAQSLESVEAKNRGCAYLKALELLRI